MANRMRDVANMIRTASRDFPLDVANRVEKNGRIFIELTAANGVSKTFSVSNNSKGDTRGDMNETSRMARFARENAPRTEKPASAEALAALVTPNPAPALMPETAQIFVPKKPRKILIVTTTKAAPKTVAPAPVTAPAADPVTPAARELTPTEFYKLCGWVKQVMLPAMADAEVAAHVASSHFSIPVTAASLKEAMAATETPEPEEWTKPEEPYVVVARELETIMRELGRAPSPAFNRLMASLHA